MTRIIKCLTLLATVGLVATNATAQQVQQRGPQAQQRGSQNQKLMSKDELTKKYDTNNDGTLDYREKMAFIKSLDENQKAAYRSRFTQAVRDQQPGQREPQGQRDQQAQHGQQRGTQAQGGPPWMQGRGSRGGSFR